MKSKIWADSPQKFPGQEWSDTPLAHVLELHPMGEGFWGEYVASDYDGGVEVHLVEEEESAPLKVEEIFLYVTEDAAAEASEDTAYSRFQGDLPFGLEREFGTSEVEALLGEPVHRRKEIPDSPVGFLGASLRFNFAGGGDVSVEFKDDAIHRIVIGRKRFD
ncbi:hypothetical protein [Shimia sp. MIT1388]|uniref:hypothetical protein n=1 Tax=Shimia sp. MIT1388 TaxID=3096992 RepID=UPI00399A3481